MTRPSFDDLIDRVDSGADQALEHVVCRECYPRTHAHPRGLCGADATGQGRQGAGHADALKLTRCPMCAEQLRDQRGCPHAPSGRLP